MSTCARLLYRWVILCFVGFAVVYGVAGAEQPSTRSENSAENGLVLLHVFDEAGAPLPCRIHLKGETEAGEWEVVRPPGTTFFHDHFACDGNSTLYLPTGHYRLEVERGHAYRANRTDFYLAGGTTQRKVIRLKQMVDMHELGWYSGDMHIHRPLEDVQLLMRCDDLDVGPVITWWNQNSLWQGRELPATTSFEFDGGRWSDLMGGEDEREGGALMFFGCASPLDIREAKREFPSPMHFVELARRLDPDVWIDVEKPFWWDMPVWVASRQVDSIGIANNHMCRNQVLANEAWGKPRPYDQFPGVSGNGLWSQEIYYHLLNAGERLPPSAGSASGVLPNPVGFNRVFVHVVGDWSVEKWWEGLRSGRTFVTNGPLLDIRASQELPGYTFELDEAGKLQVEFTGVVHCDLGEVWLEIVHNGEILRRIDFQGDLPHEFEISHRFEQAGWFLVRVRTNRETDFRFASSAPFYIEGDGESDWIRADSVRFFIDWIEERKTRITDTLSDAQELQSVLRYQDAAQQYWRNKLDKQTP